MIRRKTIRIDYGWNMKKAWKLLKKKEHQNNKRTIIRVLLAVLAAAFVCVGCGTLVGNETGTVDGAWDLADSGENEMEVHFIDVGQGDATLIKAAGHNMLIDAGDNNHGTMVQLYLKKQGVEKLDYLVLTHVDEDHIGGADVIISKLDIENIFIGDFPKNNKTYRELLDSMAYKHMDYSIPKVGSEYRLGAARFTILAPNDTYEDANNSGIALILEHGEQSFLFSGDCEKEAEADILANGIDLHVDVYKAGHHGSSTSSSEAFLDAMTPKFAIISCAENNSYGHPHAETMNHLRERKIKVFRTDEQGSIVAYSDGENLTWNCSPSESWQQGEKTQADGAQGNAGNQKVTYAVNAGNGKIHIVGACAATGDGEGAMKHPVYFDTYEEAESYAMETAPEAEQRRCGNCW